MKIVPVVKEPQKLYFRYCIHSCQQFRSHTAHHGLRRSHAVGCLVAKPSRAEWLENLVYVSLPIVGWCRSRVHRSAQGQNFLQTLGLQMRNCPQPSCNECIKVRAPPLYENDEPICQYATTEDINNLFPNSRNPVVRNTCGCHDWRRKCNYDFKTHHFQTLWYAACIPW